MQPTVYFIGAGPGDPELITRKGYRLIGECDVIIFAGSLVNPEVFAHCKAGTAIHDSASMDLGQIIAVMKEAHEKGQRVARIHTGDPSIYGSIREQIEDLNKLEISWQVIPGVSSFTASAAALGREFTVPNLTQTIICTRMEGRTPVPARESISQLAQHQASMAIFLSVSMIGDLCEQLRTHYPATTPIAVIERATWPGQNIVKGTLEDIAEKVAEAGIRKTAMILVGEFLGDTYENSKLYAADFGHEYRDARTCGE